MSQQIIRVDAFARRPFRGNPAAVCVMEKAADEEWMQQVALEMNLSETAFLYPYEAGYHIRWFRPRTEADLCGHATLASAHVLYEDGHVKKTDRIPLFTRAGWVSVTREDDWIVLDFPSFPPKQIEPPTELIEALDEVPVYVGDYGAGYLVELASDTLVRNLKPNMAAIKALDKAKLCVTAADTSGKADFVSRLFAPQLGIDEDPVNGNSHTALTPYWSERLGQETLIGHSVSKRTGVLKLTNLGERVNIAGQAVTVMRGKLTV